MTLKKRIKFQTFSQAWGIPKKVKPIQENQKELPPKKEIIDTPPQLKKNPQQESKKPLLIQKPEHYLPKKVEKETLSQSLPQNTSISLTP